jgi:hypothetical protein
MRTPSVAAVTLALALGPAAPLGAADAELVPLTGPPVAAHAPVPLPTGFYRASRWDVWQYYAVDRTGHWRPRVALQPEPHYLYSGAPYLYLPVRPLSVMPYLFD